MKTNIQSLRIAREIWRNDPSPDNTEEVERLWKICFPKSTRAGRLRRKHWGDRGTSEGKKWLALLDQYGHQCLCCGASDEGGKVQLVPDHVIPLSKGGKDSITNIQPLCFACNDVKGANSTDFRKSYPFRKLSVSKIT